jgi:RNA polymerase sigma-70 factor, ECF subfamily
MSDARHAAEAAARASYGRLVASLAARSRDIAAAEDALADAFAAALRVWPERGVPQNPEAWLWTAARRTLGHGARAARVRVAAQDAVAALFDREPPTGDRRLALLFACAHPAIDPAIRTPLMLQVVLGLDAARVGAAFLVAPTAMAQRLVRAKAKIRDAGVPFEIPERAELPPRLDDVLAAIYAAYGTGWDALAGADGVDPGLTAEALYLGRLVAALLPDEPEPKGLVALMAYCEARRAARRDATGRYVPLAEQDPTLWSRELLIEAEASLTAASQLRRFGRFQCEAAIQSVHSQAVLLRRPAPDVLVRLYDLLVQQAPTLGAWVGRAAALAEAAGPEVALAALDALPAPAVATYQPYWATRAHVLDRLGIDATDARQRAAELAPDPAVRAWLTRA